MISLQTFTPTERAWLMAVATDYIEAWRDVCALADPAEYVDPPLDVVYAITQVDEIPECWFPTPPHAEQLRGWVEKERDLRRDLYHNKTATDDQRLFGHESLQVASSIIRKLSVTGV